MARLQVNLHFLRSELDEADELVSCKVKAEASGGTTSQLASIEISLDGETIFTSQNCLPKQKENRPKISQCLLDPRDVMINLTIDNADDSQQSGKEKGRNRSRYVDVATGDPVPVFPDCEDEESRQTAGTTTSTTETMVSSNEQQVMDALLTEEDAAEVTSNAEPESEGKDCVVTESEKYSFLTATLMTSCREVMRKDAEVQTTVDEKRACALQTNPRYLTRVGAAVKTVHRMPLA